MSLPTPPPQFMAAPTPLNLNNINLARTYSYPLTPSLTSPFRASRAPRPKPYHRQSEIECHARHLGTELQLVSPNPTVDNHCHRRKHDNHQQQQKKKKTVASTLARSQSLLSGGAAFQPLPQMQHLVPPIVDAYSGHQCTLQRSETAPALLPFALTSASLPPQMQLQPDGLQASPQPVICVETPQPQPAEPLVFPTEYIEERLARYLSSTTAESQTQEPYWPTEGLSRQATLIDTSSTALSDQSSFFASSANSSYFPTPATSIGAYVSAYAPASTSFSIQCPIRSDSLSSLASTVVGSDTSGEDDDPKPKVKTPAEKLAEEKKRQRQAAELIEMVIESIHKSWPETVEPDAMYQVNPVRRNGELRETVYSTTSCQHQHPLTPESSPTMGNKKRKHEETDDYAHVLKKRSCIEGDAVKTLTIVPHPSAPQGVDDSQDITLRKFVRELLRRSKTSCTTLEVALCYLDGIEDTVRKLKDCVKLGIAFGTAAMAERGPYDEGMKDEGRIVKFEDLLKFEESTCLDDSMLDQQDSWIPERETPSGRSSFPPLQNQVLATHPLLDARRTFLASLVLATKFVQDKAYSNKAWAKLSGLGGKEVGRCERALGGALGWRLWVGKDCDGNSVLSRSRPSTPVVVESNNPPSSISVDSDDSPIHGEYDLLATQFMAEANMMAEMREKAKAEGVMTTLAHPMTMAFGSGLVAPAPQAPAQVGNPLGLTTRAACGRAKTWPSLVVNTSLCNNTGDVVLNTSVSAPAFTTTFSQLSEDLAAVRIQSAASTPCQSSSDVSWLDQILQESNSQLGSRSILTLDQAIQLSPQPLEGYTNRELQLLPEESGIATVPATPTTVKITVDDVDSAFGPRTCHPIGASLATPYLSMAGSFSIPDSANSPMARFIEPWQNIPSYPFTFTAEPQPVPQPQSSKLLHPQTAALRLVACGSSGSSNGSSASPNSASTFSSPEVLTPIHSRAPTVVDGMDLVQTRGSPLRPLVKSASMPYQMGIESFNAYDFSEAFIPGRGFVANEI